jgi:predicted Zn-ribbon and HTH transcriptional regulator
MISEVELPSSLCSIPDYPKKVSISTLNVKAFKIYSNITESSNMISVLKEIASICVKDCDVGKLKFQDFMFLVMWLRINSAIPGCNNEFEYTAVCPDCGHEFQRKVDLTTIPINSLKDYKEPELIQLYSEDQKIGLKILSTDEEIQLFNLLRDEDPLIKDNVSIIRAGFTIHSNNMSIRDKLHFLNSLTDVKDLASILGFIEKYSEWGFSFKDMNVKCPKCSKSNTLVLPLQSGLIIPTISTDGYFERARVN